MNRQQIEADYNISLTDNQWRILQAEVDEKEDWEDTDGVIQDVCDNIISYEQEYEWWENLTKKKA